MHSVSVVVPVYNVERYLWQCLESLRSELGGALQVIVVDDGSTDASRELAERFIAGSRRDAGPTTPDFLLVSQENAGYGAAVNRGFSLADGAYVGIVESDDYLAGDQFGALFAIARAAGTPDIVKAPYLRVFLPDTPEQRVWYSLLRHRGVPTWREGPTDLGRSPELVRWHPSVWSAIYRRDFLAATGTSFLEAAGGGWVDNPFVMRAMAQAGSIAYTDEAWYCYREDRPGSSSVLKDPALPLVRWQQMAAEVAASRWAGDERVLATLYAIAFQHLGRLWGTPAYEGVRALAEEIMGVMQPEIVLGMSELSPAAKRRYRAATGASGRPGGAGGAGAHARYLAREFAHSARENGLEFALWRAGLKRIEAPSGPHEEGDPA